MVLVQRTHSTEKQDTLPNNKHTHTYKVGWKRVLPCADH